MKNLHIALCLSGFLLLFALFVFLPKSTAQGNVLNDLLSLPAPPPPNPDFVFTIDSNSRSPEFYSQENPPPDDAPIGELLDYWARQSGLNAVYNPTIKPSDKVLNRILGEIEKNPELIGGYLNLMGDKPSAVAVVKRMYENSLADKSANEYQSEQLKAWLQYNTDYFSDELTQAAGQVKDANDYVTNQEDLLALARVDWDKALPLLNRMVNDSSQPISQTLANWAFYLHAIKDGNSIEADRYRSALMKVVEDKKTLPGNRDLALDALVYGGDFQGRDDWYFSLLEDETLYDLRVGGRSYTGLTTLLMRSPPDKYIDKMIELVRSGNQTVRNAAARNLMTVLKGNDPKIVTALLPWLENPNWAKQVNNERRLLVVALSEVEIPESVPGLIALLDEKPAGGNSNSSYPSNRMSSNMMDAPDYDSEGTYPYRSAAISALAKQKSLQAVPALRRILPEVEEWERETVVKAILDSGGFSIAEQVDALESVAESVRIQTESDEKMAANYATANSGYVDEDDEDVAFVVAPRAMAMATDRMSNRMSDDKKPFNSADIKPILGRQVAGISEPSRELVTAVVSRINALESRNPALANALRKIIESWNGPAVNALMLTDLGNGKADADVIVKLLSLRKELQEKQSNDVFAARNAGNPTALGITSCLLENQTEYAQILAGDNAEMKVAMLGCARLIRAKLPLQAVAENLKSPNKMLAKAAELYIESEDSPEARGIIYALYPDKAKILGATLFFAPDNVKFGNVEFLSALFSSVNEKSALPSYLIYGAMTDKGILQTEKILQKEITKNTELVGIYSYNENFVRIYEDKVVFSWSENDARYRERTLNGREFDYLKNYLASNNVNTIPPFIGECGGCEARELLMLGANGGRRIYAISDTMPEFFAGLDKIFDDFRKPPAKLKYHLETDVAGLEILYADDKYAAQTVWKNGADLRLLIEDSELRKQIDEELRRADVAAYQNSSEDKDYLKLEEESVKRRQQRAYDHYSWRNLTGERLGDYVGQPPEFEAIPKKDNMPVPSDNEQWKRRAGSVELRSGNEELYRVKSGQAVKIQDGYYNEPVISADGRWAIAQKYDYENEDEYLVRINVQTGKETRVKVDEKFGTVRPVVFVTSVNKFLVVAGGYYDHDSERTRNGTFYMLDADTGVIQPIKGEVQPLVQQTFRSLQTNGKPDEFWAAIPGTKKETTEIGVYNAKTFMFTPKLKIPRIAFDSMNLWVDEPGNKIYFVYQGQLLALPLTKRE